MGKEARLRAQERMEAGIIPIRFGRKQRAKDRKREIKSSHIRFDFPRGTKPITKEEKDDLFEKARRVKTEIAQGIRPPVPVELADVDLPAASQAHIDLLAESVHVAMQTPFFNRRHKENP